jgi:hypothetical protein
MVQIIILPILSAVITLLSIFIVKIRKSDPHLYELNRESFARPSTATGSAEEGVGASPPDGNMHRGLVFDRVKKKLELQDALSQEAINRILT